MVSRPATSKRPGPVAVMRVDWKLAFGKRAV